MARIAPSLNRSSDVCYQIIILVVWQNFGSFDKRQFMKQKVLAVLIVAAMAANAQDSAPRVAMPQEDHWYDRLLVPYQPRLVPPVSFENSRRLESLLRAGKLYLSLQDAIALALENNLDIELERFAPGLAEFDTLRTRGGATPRGLSYSILELPQGIGGAGHPPPPAHTREGA